MTEPARILIVGGRDVDGRLPLARFLSPRWQVTIAMGHHENGPNEHSFEPYHLAPGASPTSEVRTVWQLKKLLDRIEPTIVHLFDTKPSVLGRLARRLSRTRSACVITVPGVGILASEDLSSRAMARLAVRPLLRVLQRDADAYVFQTAHDRDFYLAHGLATERASSVIRGSGVDVNHFSRDKITPEAVSNWRREARVSPTDIVVLCISRLQKEKGVLEFARAVRGIRSESSAVRGVLLGQWTESERWALSRDEVKEVETSIVWIGTQQDVRPALANAAVFVLPTRYGEGIPRAALEATAMGVPVILGDSPGCVELTDGGKHGLILPSPNAGAVAAAVQMVLADLGPRRAIVDEARRTRLPMFSSDRVFGEYEAIYESVLQK